MSRAQQRAQEEEGTGEGTPRRGKAAAGPAPEETARLKAAGEEGRREEAVLGSEAAGGEQQAQL